MAYAIVALNKQIKEIEYELEACDNLPYEAELADLLVQLELAAQDLKDAYIKSLDPNCTNKFTYEELIAEHN